MKNYYEVKIFVEREYLDPLTYTLEGMGVEGFLIEDPADLSEFLRKKNSYDWDYVDESVMELKNARLNVTIYLDVDNPILIASFLNLDNLGSHEEVTLALNEDNIKKSLKAESIKIDEAIVKFVCEDQWKDNWKKYFKPAKVSKRIVVVPTWEEYTPKMPDELIIKIDPGMAFGTGTHETTSLCIKLLEKYLKVGQGVLDVGCGSGILSIAAALLGASKVVGVDIDLDAVRVSEENVELNFPCQTYENSQENYMEKSSEVIIGYGDLTKGLEFKADLIVANLMADLVIMLSGDVAKHLRGDSIYISSGILIEKKGLVAEAIEKAGFTILEILEDGEWCAICAKLQ